MKEIKILITRPEPQSNSFQKLVEDTGAKAIILPLIAIEPYEDQTTIGEIFEHLDQFDWLVFTSANAVNFFFKKVEAFKVKLYFYPQLKIATVGEKTKKALEILGYRTNFVPITFTAEVLAENMEKDLKGKKILIPRSSKASDEYLNVFIKRGALPTPITVYNNSAIEYPKEKLTSILAEKIDYLTFASGSAVKSFDQQIKKHRLKLSDEKIICIGPSTAKVAEQLGYKVSRIANLHTEEGMLEEIKKIEKCSDPVD